MHTCHEVVHALQSSTALVRGLAEVVRRRAQQSLGPEFEDICHEPGERMISLDVLRSLLAQAVRKTGDPALGLHWGISASPSSFGVMTPLISYASSLRHALGLVSQFYVLFTEGAHFELVECMGTARLVCELPPGLNKLEPTLVEFMQAGLMRMFAEFGCTPMEIRAVCFEYARPAHSRVYTLAFSGRERFAQSFTGFEFATAALERPNPYYQPELQALMLEQAERKLERRVKPQGCAERVRSLLSSAPPNQLPDMNALARRLGLGVRSLRRRLAEEGTSYHELTQALVRDAACSLLRNQRLTFQDVAHALGFSTSTAFHRAFRRWFDLTPSEYRASRWALTGRPPRE